MEIPKKQDFTTVASGKDENMSMVVAVSILFLLLLSMGGLLYIYKDNQIIEKQEQFKEIQSDIPTDEMMENIEDIVVLEDKNLENEFIVSDLYNNFFDNQNLKLCDGLYKSQNFEFKCPQDTQFLTITEKTPQNYHPNNSIKIEPEKYEAILLISDNGKPLGVTVGIVPLNYINLTYRLWSDKKISVEIDGREAVKYQIQTDNQNEEAYIVPLSVKESVVVKFYPDIAKNVFSDKQFDQLIGSIILKDIDYISGEWISYESNNLGFSFKHPETTIITENKNDISMWPVDRTNAHIRIFNIDSFKQSSLWKYNKLQSLTSDFDSYKTLTSETDGIESEMPRAKYIDQKIKVDGLPALDVVMCGGGDGCSRSIYVLRDDSVIEIFHNFGYIKYGPLGECGKGCSNPVKPLQRIDNYTDFDKLLTTFKFL